MGVYPPAKKIRRRRAFFGSPGGAPSTSCSSGDDLISLLPDDLSQVIFGFLPSARDRCACAAASKRWLVLLAQMRGCEFNSFRRTLRSRTSPTKLRFYTTADDAAYDKVKHSTIAGAVKEKGDGSAGFDDEPEASRCLEDKEANDARMAAMAVGTYARRLLGNLSVRGGYAASAVSHHRPSHESLLPPPPPQRVTDFGLEIVSQSFPNLRSLSLWDCLKVGSTGLASIARCHALERLDISNSPEIGDEGLISIARGCPSLSALTLQSCPRVGDRTLEALAHCSSHLRSVSISDCPAVGDSGVVSLVSMLPELTKLRLTRLQVGDASIEAVGQNVQGSLIRSLFLEDLTGLTAKGFAWVRFGDANGCRPNGCSSSKLEFLNLRTVTEPERTTAPVARSSLGALRRVSIKKCGLLDDETLLGLALSSCRLEELRLERCPNITARGVLAAMKSCSRTLKLLSLIKCDAVASDGTPLQLDPLLDVRHASCRSTAVDHDNGRMVCCSLPTSTPFCPHLDSLTLKNCTGVDDRILTSIAPALSAVTRIVLEGLPSVSDSGILSLVQWVTPSSVSPVCISLAGCSGLSDWSVLALARAYGARLQVLNLDGCSRVGNGGLRAVAELCPTLRDLDVGATRVGDTGIAALAAAESRGLRLEVLSLSGCSAITDEGLTWLELMCGARLVGINLKHCAGVSRRALDSFRCAFWWCDVLY